MGVPSPLFQKYLKINICGQQTKQFKEHLRYIQALIQTIALFKVPPTHEPTSYIILMAMLVTASEIHKPL